MNIHDIQQRTKTLYAVIHAFETAKAIHFGNLAFIPESLDRARAWINPECSFTTSIPTPQKTAKRPTVRTDPNKDFAKIAEVLVAMFIQDFVNLLDSLMGETLLARKLRAGAFPQSKIEKLAVGLDPKHLWSKNGCLELVAVRNALVHNNASWNQRSLDIIRPFAKPMPAVGDRITIGFPMLFLYRKAIRTFANETKKLP